MEDFLNYADVLFQNYGDRIKYWLPLNEPQANCQFGWGAGMFAPGIKGGDPVHFDCFHRSHILHARIVHLARTKYADKAKNWKFGIPSIISWIEPVDPQNKAGGCRIARFLSVANRVANTRCPSDVDKANFDLGKYAGWFFDPTVFGDVSVETCVFMPFVPRHLY